MFKKLSKWFKKNLLKIIAIVAIAIAIYFTCGAVAAWSGSTLGPMWGSFGLITASSSTAVNVALAGAVLAGAYMVAPDETKEAMSKIGDGVEDVVAQVGKAVNKATEVVTKSTTSVVDGLFKSKVIKVAAIGACLFFFWRTNGSKNS